MPSTETFAANQGQNSWRGVPLRSASVMTLAPLSSSGRPAVVVYPWVVCPAGWLVAMALTPRGRCTRQSWAGARGGTVPDMSVQVKHEAVASSLSRDILRGVLGPGERLAGEHQLA